MQRSARDIDVNTNEADNPRARELEGRIEELETRDEAAFGRFTSWDWTVCIVFALVLPLLGVWWWAP
jgi:hypothetical protein